MTKAGRVAQANSREFGECIGGLARGILRSMSPDRGGEEGVYGGESARGEHGGIL